MHIRDTQFTDIKSSWYYELRRKKLNETKPCLVKQNER